MFLIPLICNSSSVKSLYMFNFITKLFKDYKVNCPWINLLWNHVIHYSNLKSIQRVLNDRDRKICQIFSSKSFLYDPKDLGEDQRPGLDNFYANFCTCISYFRLVESNMSCFSYGLDCKYLIQNMECFIEHFR